MNCLGPSESRRLLEEIQLEKDTAKAVVDYSAVIGIKLFPIKERIPRRGQKPSPAGLPDFFGWVPARLIYPHRKGDALPVPLFVECKRPCGGKISPAQLAFAEVARADGAIILFPNTLETYVSGLKFYGVNAPDLK